MVFKETAKNQNAVFKNGSLSNAYNNREILPMFAKKNKLKFCFLPYGKKFWLFYKVRHILYFGQNKLYHFHK